MPPAAPSAVPTIGQIVRRCVALVRAVDLVHGFSCYTALVVLVDVLRHGSQHLAFASLLYALAFSGKRRGALLQLLSANADLAVAGLCSAAGLLLAAASQALLRRLMGDRRLPLAALLRGSFPETAGPAAIFALVCLGDVLALTARVDVAWLRQGLHVLLEATTSTGLPDSRSSTSYRVLLGVALQVLARASLVVSLWRAHQRRMAKVLP
mmetsp:Transcript_42746/g.96473  ORF Transcript_42746/g.96473 Transcript_42746/m.96473 type:complete len:210 (+) Transcript_42746:48-677(+)